MIKGVIKIGLFPLISEPSPIKAAKIIVLPLLVTCEMASKQNATKSLRKEKPKKLQLVSPLATLMRIIPPAITSGSVIL